MPCCDWSCSSPPSWPGGVALAVHGPPDFETLRSSVTDAGAWAPLAFVAFYAGMALLPAPKSVITILGGVLFGLVGGATLAWAGAVLGSVAAFGICRLVGRDGLDRLIGGRLRAVGRLLDEHGVGTILVIRLVPIFPFTAVNYGAGVSRIGFGPYLVGTALGIVPGTVAYVALGAYGDTNLVVVALAAAALVVLASVGGAFARRHLTGRSDGAGTATRAGTEHV